MKIILEIPELEAIVKENIASKYPNQDAKVTVQNKRNGVEVTVVLTDKAYKDETAKSWNNVSEELVATGCCGTTAEAEEEEEEEETSGNNSGPEEA